MNHVYQINIDDCVIGFFIYDEIMTMREKIHVLDMITRDPDYKFAEIKYRGLAEASDSLVVIK